MQSIRKTTKTAEFN